MTSENSEIFVNNFEKLLNGVKVDLYKSGLSSMFEYVCGTLFSNARDTDIWYDGIVDIVINSRKKSQIELNGYMWVAKAQKTQWKETFHAIITDKRITKQGIWLSVNIGEYHAEGNIYELL